VYTQLPGILSSKRKLKLRPGKGARARGANRIRHAEIIVLGCCYMYCRPAGFVTRERIHGTGQIISHAGVLSTLSPKHLHCVWRCVSSIIYSGVSVLAVKDSCRQIPFVEKSILNIVRFTHYLRIFEHICVPSHFPFPLFSPLIPGIYGLVLIGRSTPSPSPPPSSVASNYAPSGFSFELLAYFNRLEVSKYTYV
jgi:hypothetical protein